MKVLFQTKSVQGPPLSIVREQMLQLKAWLEKLDVKVVISSSANVNIKDFDLVHIFNCFEVSDTYNFYMNAVNQKKKIVVTPFFIDMHEHYKNNPAELAQWRVDNLLRREIMQGSHMLLVHSQKEAYGIQNVLCVEAPVKVMFQYWGKQDMEAAIVQSILDIYQQVLDTKNSPKWQGKFLYTQVYNLPEIKSDS